MNNNYVYGYFDKNQIPFYIGLGKNNRLNHHLTPSVLKTKKLPFFYSKLSKMISNNEKFHIKIIKNNLTRNEAEIIEQILISLIGRRDLNTGTLCNLTDGGDGALNCIVKEKTRVKLSQKSKGRKLSKEHKNILRKCNLGKIHSKETRLKMSIGQRGTSKPKKNIIEFKKKCKIAAQERLNDAKYVEKHKKGVRKNHEVKIVQMFNGKDMRIWNNQYDAIDYLKKGRPDRIINCCEKKQKTHCNFNWRYL